MMLAGKLILLNGLDPDADSALVDTRDIEAPNEPISTLNIDPQHYLWARP